MIPTNITIVFIAVVFVLFWYVFRGLREGEQNPVWGNLFASSVNCILCGILAYSFLTGNVMDMNVVENASYTINYRMVDSSLIQTIDMNATADRQYRLGPSGSGMYTISAIDSMSDVKPYLGNFTVSYLTKDIVYLQIQDRAVSYFYVFLALCNAAIFVYFAYRLVHDSWFGEESSGEPQDDDGGGDY